MAAFENLSKLNLMGHFFPMMSVQNQSLEKISVSPRCSLLLFVLRSSCSHLLRQDLHRTLYLQNLSLLLLYHLFGSCQLLLHSLVSSLYLLYLSFFFLYDFKRGNSFLFKLFLKLINLRICLLSCLGFLLLQLSILCAHFRQLSMQSHHGSLVLLQFFAQSCLLLLCDCLNLRDEIVLFLVGLSESLIEFLLLFFRRCHSQF